jgi:hypothetical protein
MIYSPIKGWFSFGGSAGRGGPGDAAGKGLRQSDELADFADFFLEGLAGEYLSHLKFHKAYR